MVSLSATISPAAVFLGELCMDSSLSEPPEDVELGMWKSGVVGELAAISNTFRRYSASASATFENSSSHKEESDWATSVLQTASANCVGSGDSDAATSSSKVRNAGESEQYAYAR